MSPIDENELRDELWFATPASGPRPDALGAAVITRGRGVRRRRVAAASLAAVAVVALAGVGVWNVLPRGDQHAVPAQTPTATAVSPVPRPGMIPADSGTALRDRPLPLEKDPVPDEMGPVESHEESVTCADGRVVDLPSLAGLDASRLRGRTDAGDGYRQDGVLVFRSEADASAFMAELGRTLAACDPVGPPGDNTGTPEEPVIERTRMATGPGTDPGQAAFSVRTWIERNVDGAWLEAPGGTLILWGQRGRTVAFHSYSGEYVGDPLAHSTPGAPEYRALADLLTVG